MMCPAKWKNINSARNLLEAEKRPVWFLWFLKWIRPIWTKLWSKWDMRPPKFRCLRKLKRRKKSVLNPREKRSQNMLSLPHHLLNNQKIKAEKRLRKRAMVCHGPRMMDCLAGEKVTANGLLLRKEAAHSAG